MGYGGSQRSIKIPKEQGHGKGQTLRVLEIPPPIKNGGRSPRRDDHLVLAYRCFNLRPYQPTVTIIKNIIDIFAHSESVGIGSGDGVGGIAGITGPLAVDAVLVPVVLVAVSWQV